MWLCLLIQRNIFLCSASETGNNCSGYLVFFLFVCDKRHLSGLLNSISLLSLFIWENKGQSFCCVLVMVIWHGIGVMMRDVTELSSCHVPKWSSKLVINIQLMFCLGLSRKLYWQVGIFYFYFFSFEGKISVCRSVIISGVILYKCF